MQREHIRKGMIVRLVVDYLSVPAGTLATLNLLKPLRDLWSRRPGLNGATCHRFGAEPCLTDSYEGGQPPCTIPTKGTHPLRNPSGR